MWQEVKTFYDPENETWMVCLMASGERQYVANGEGVSRDQATQRMKQAARKARGQSNMTGEAVDRITGTP